jgi:hypothetical protein
MIYRNDKIGKEEFISRSRKIHGDKYDYSLVEYNGRGQKVKIICPIHGMFEQIAYSHFYTGSGCVKCSYEYRQKYKKSNKKEWIEKAIKKHGDRYDYSKVVYKDCKTPVTIICKEHGEYQQTTVDHLRTMGCRKCNKSKGELEVEMYLKKHNIEYETQKTFPELRNDNNTASLRFDFYLPEYNLCIEYDGVQHFHPVNFGNSKMKKEQIQGAFNITTRNDEIKNMFCINNDIDILRLNYKQKVEYNLERTFNEKISIMAD